MSARKWSLSALAISTCLASATAGAVVVAAAGRAPRAAPKSVELEAAEPAPCTGRERLLLRPSFCVAAHEGPSACHLPAIQYSQDGSRLLGASCKGDLFVWDVSDRAGCRRIRFSLEPVDCVGFTADCRFLVFGHQSGGVRVFDIEEECVLASSAGERASWVAPSPSGECVAVASGSSVQVLTLPDLRLSNYFLDHVKPVTQVAWRKDGKFLGISGMDGCITVRRFPEGTLSCVIRKNYPLHALAFHPTTGAVVYGGKDRKIYACDPRLGLETALYAHQPYEITSIGFSPDGSVFAIGDESCDLWVFQSSNLALISHQKHHQECWVNCVAWSPDGKRVVFGCRPNRTGTPAAAESNLMCEAGLAPRVVEIESRIRAKEEEVRQLCKLGETSAILIQGVQVLGQYLAASADRLDSLSLVESGRRLRASTGAASLERAIVQTVFETEVEAGPSPGSPAFHDAGSAAARRAAYVRFGERRVRLSKSRPFGRESIECIGALDQRLKSDPAACRLLFERAALIEVRRGAMHEEVESLRSRFLVNQWGLVRD